MQQSDQNLKSSDGVSRLMTFYHLWHDLEARRSKRADDWSVDAAQSDLVEFACAAGGPFTLEDAAFMLALWCSHRRSERFTDDDRLVLSALSTLAGVLHLDDFSPVAVSRSDTDSAPAQDG